MRKTTVLGATALLVAGLMVPSAAAFAAPVAGAPVATTGDADTCPKNGKVDVEGDHKTLVVTAPDGYLITGYCVKAGSVKQGLGPEFVEVDPPASQVTISHSSGKDISHYTLETVKVEPTPEPTEPGTEPTEPGTEPTPEPVEESAAPGEAEGATPAPAGDETEELAATGASTVVGFTLIALALVGGGVTLIVLRRKGVLGS